VARKKHLQSLEAFLQEEPHSLIARLREAIPLIEAGLTAGHSLRSIHQRLNEAGFTIAYYTLATYRRRLKGSKPVSPLRKPLKVDVAPEVAEKGELQTTAPDGFDPATSFRKHADKQVTWEYPSGPPDEKKLV
jgi:hypothetical protein